MTGLDWDARLVLAFAEATAGKVYGPGGRTSTNCCIAVEDVLALLYGDRVRQQHAAFMVLDPSQPFSPADACAELGIGRLVDTPVHGRWHVVQGWRALDGNGWVPDPSPSPNGHTFLFYEPASGVPGAGRLLNANTTRPWVLPRTWGEARGPYRAGVRLAVLEAV